MDISTIRGCMKADAFDAVNRDETTTGQRARLYIVAGHSLAEIGKIQNPLVGEDAVRRSVRRWVRRYGLQLEMPEVVRAYAKHRASVGGEL